MISATDIIGTVFVALLIYAFVRNRVKEMRAGAEREWEAQRAERAEALRVAEEIRVGSTPMVMAEVKRRAQAQLDRDTKRAATGEPYRPNSESQDLLTGMAIGMVMNDSSPSAESSWSGDGGSFSGGGASGGWDSGSSFDSGSSDSGGSSGGD